MGSMDGARALIVGIAEYQHIRRLPHPGETLLIDLRMHRGHTEGATVTGEARVGSEIMATLDRNKVIVLP